jgi:hypothetical protein
LSGGGKLASDDVWRVIRQAADKVGCQWDELIESDSGHRITVRDFGEHPTEGKRVKAQTHSGDAPRHISLRIYIDQVRPRVSNERAAWNVISSHDARFIKRQ